MSTSAPTVRQDTIVALAGAPTPVTPVNGEFLVIDPDEIVGTGRIPFDITPYVGGTGPDFGNAEITQYLADSGQIGQTQIDFRIPNRVITIPLVMQDRGAGMTYEQVRAAFQQKVALLQRKGGILQRSLPLGAIYAEIVGASLKFGGSNYQATQNIDPDATLTLVTMPDWYGDEVTLAAQNFGAGFGSIILNTPIKGDFPGRLRMVVHNLGGDDQRGFIWGMRSFNYSTDTTAATVYNPSQLIPVSPTVISGTSLSLSNITISSDPYNPVWMPMCSTLVTNQGDMTHIGSYRIWAKMSATAASGNSTVSVRLVWDSGNLVVGTPNASAKIPGYGNPYLVDLGQIRIEEAPIGNHHWQGQIQVMSLGGSTGSASESVSMLRIYIVPVDEGYGKLASAPISDAVSGANDAVIGANSTAEIRTDGAFRALTIGTSSVYSPVTQVIGDLPRLPVSGMENRTIEISLISTASDFQTLSDNTSSSTTVQLIYAPCYLFVPES